MSAYRGKRRGSIVDMFADMRGATVDDVHLVGDMHEFPAERTVAEAWKDLHARHISSAPVYEAESKKFLGFVEIADVVALLVKVYNEIEHDNDHDDFKKTFCEKAVEVFKTSTCKDIIGLAKRDDYATVQKDSSLFDALRTLRAADRVSVLDENGVIVNLLTQSAVVEFFGRAMEDLRYWKLQKPIGALNVGRQKNVIKIEGEKPAIDGFKLMVAEKLSGIAVLGEDGKLISNLSLSDIKACLIEEGFSVLFKPVTHLLQVIRSQNSMTTVAALDCTLNSTFGNVIMRLAATHMHHLFIVNSESVPIGVISVGDAFAELVEEALQ